MQRMIWIPDDLVEGIKESANKEGKSVSQYLVDLHRKISEVKEGILRDYVTPPKERYGESPVETTKREIKTLLDEKPIKDQIKAVSKYSEEYRKRNPMEECSYCGKALRFNCGH
jgi:hypothetical protein